MSQSTPLNQLPNSQPVQDMSSPQTDNDLVNDILNEMDSAPEMTNDMNSDSLNYAMDPSQVPLPKMEQNFLSSENNQSDNSANNSNNNSSQNDNSQNTNTKKSLFGLNFSLGGGGNSSGNSNTMLSKCVNKLKLLLVVFVLVFITSMPQFNRLVLTKLPSFLNESGAINMKGILFKTSLVATLFLLVSFFV